MLVRSCRSCFAAVSKLPPTCTVQTMYVRRRTGASCFFRGGERGDRGPCIRPISRLAVRAFSLFLFPPSLPSLASSSFLRMESRFMITAYLRCMYSGHNGSAPRQTDWSYHLPDHCVKRFFFLGQETKEHAGAWCPFLVEETLLPRRRRPRRLRRGILAPGKVSLRQRKKRVWKLTAKALFFCEYSPGLRVQHMSHHHIHSTARLSISTGSGQHAHPNALSRWRGCDILSHHIA